jgi:2'-5' RNA ligase
MEQKLKSVFRAFTAIDLSPTIIERIAQISDGLQTKLAGMPIRWVPAGNYHLTLKFLGDVSVANVEMIQEIIYSVANGSQAFEMSVGGFGVFPNEKRPRIIWIGIEAPPVLFSIQRNIDHDTARLGYQTDEREFAPHLTLGRVSRNANHAEIRQMSEILKAETVGFIGATRVKALHLYRSDLQPGGAVYNKVYSANLRD